MDWVFDKTLEKQGYLAKQIQHFLEAIGHKLTLLEGAKISVNKILEEEIKNNSEP